MRLDPGQIEVMDDTMVEVLRQKEPWERIAIGFSLWESAWNRLVSLLTGLHPEWSEDQVRREVVKRMSHGTV
ncbi:MAG: hypothetical protein WAO55_10995 [Candidatus Manganitrophaceae bacterium]